jgi:hypothetical protein
MQAINLSILEKNGQAIACVAPLRQLLLAGYTGRDRALVQAHIRELEELGVPPPERVPMVYVVDPLLLETSATLEASGPETSGEVEFVLVQTAAEGLLVGVGSDHTDRKAEASDVAASKGMCGKRLSGEVWRVADIQGHWDAIEIRSWAVDSSGRHLYQEGRLAAFMPVASLLAELDQAGFENLGETVVFGGTLPVKDGFVYASRFEVELLDPVTRRSLGHGYDVVVPGDQT